MCFGRERSHCQTWSVDASGHDAEFGVENPCREARVEDVFQSAKASGLTVIAIFGMSWIMAGECRAQSAPPRVTTLGYAVATPGAYTAGEYVEARRPKIVRRPLTAPERARARDLVARLRAAPTSALAEQLKPLAETGDVALMTAMLDAYLANVVETPALDADSGSLSTALAGLWAMALWRQGETSREAARAIDNCRSSGRPASDSPRDCGFRFEAPRNLNRSTGFNSYWTRRGRAPRGVTFSEYPLVGSRDEDISRFQRTVSIMRTGGTVGRRDYWWSAGWSEREGGATWAIYRDAAARFEQIRNDRIETARAEAMASFRARYERWETFANKRRSGQALSEEDREAFHAAATALGGGYLDVYARFYPLPQKWEVDEVCAVRNSASCGTQRELQTHLSTGTRPTFETGGGNVSVRTYDQGGNYRGNTNLPSWALSFIGQH